VGDGLRRRRVLGEAASLLPRAPVAVALGVPREPHVVHRDAERARDVERRALVGRGPPCPLPRRRDEEHGRGGVTRRRLDVGLDARAGRDELREVRDGGPPLTAGPGWTAVTRTATEETHPAIVASDGVTLTVGVSGITA